MAKLIQKNEELPEKKMSKEELVKKLEGMKERDYEMVTGIFEYKEKPKGKLEFWYKKYPGEVPKKWTFWDGQRYRIPRMIARHLNNNIAYTEYKRIGGNGGFAQAGIVMGVDPTTRSGHEDTYANMHSVHKIPRTSFRSLEFMDDDIAAKPEIIEVAYK
jgi:hypothetical protein